ncbi:predicted protein [Plenodomus lingam JN3]|uniref:Predicted protein n=1 Tax=Leptosphaeria maculans (strain JN3 / isolate v23.1.3 / race Av1-4-5-6-7-8) TaxID=985895 RepID=E5A2G8_LEPMJ|nr:predicted protein [Plenodomus lingam JN3]CBX97764.1 predicted protein [Plenodomus lingam JN3]
MTLDVYDDDSTLCVCNSATDAHRQQQGAMTKAVKPALGRASPTDPRFRRAKLNALKRGGYVFSKLDGVEAKEYSKKARR